jgi:GH15 family glucan-1,4-alpha-glucosidase
MPKTRVFADSNAIPDGNMEIGQESRIRIFAARGIMGKRIEDYGLIGDLEGAALVGRDGSIDWLCLPRFDSPAAFAALLGTEESGFWRIAPKSEWRSSRRYREGSLVLETRFETPGGTVTVVDCMPVKAGKPETSIVRLVIGDSGSVPMRMEMAVRFDYGRGIPWVRQRPGGLTALLGPSALQLQTPVTLAGRDFRTFADFVVRAGDVVPFVLTYHNSLDSPALPEDAIALCDETTVWWQEWSKACNYTGPWREAVLRSLVTLKALTHSRTGGIVAAPTTSLPETIGGERNWDYRFCWLRDATFTLYALLTSGLDEEAKQWRDWLLRVAAGEPSQLQTIYGVDGERLLPEFEVDWLPGFEASRPVRVGNEAHRQLQLDVYGEIMDVFHVSRRHGIQETPDSWAVQTALLDFLESGWQERDNGIWEVRGPRRHFTHSKVMAWVALDRAVKAAEQFGLSGPVARWRRSRRAIHEEVCDQAFDPEIGAFTQYYGSKSLDASLLMIPLVGFLPASDPRCTATLAAVEKHLMRDGFVLRYQPDEELEGLRGTEGAFLPCSFWLADNYALMGRRQEAAELFQKLLGLRNDLGLLSEEYEPATGSLLGNFPQAFSHVSLVNTAHNLTPAGPAEHRAGS